MCMTQPPDGVLDPLDSSLRVQFYQTIQVRVNT